MNFHITLNYILTRATVSLFFLDWSSDVGVGDGVVGLAFRLRVQASPAFWEVYH